MISIERREEYLKIEIDTETIKFKGILRECDITEEEFEKLEALYSIKR